MYSINSNSSYETLPLFPVPLEIVDRVFEFLPTELPIIAQVCTLWEKMVFGVKRSDPNALVNRLWRNKLSPFDPYKKLSLRAIKSYDREQKIDLLLKDLDACPLKELTAFIQKKEWGLQLNLSQKKPDEILTPFKTALSGVEDEVILRMITDRLDQKLLNLVSSEEFKFYARTDKHMVEQIAEIRILDIGNFFKRIPIAASKLEKLKIIHMSYHTMEAKHYQNVFSIKIDSLLNSMLHSPKTSPELRRLALNARYNLILSYREILQYSTQNNNVCIGEYYLNPIPEFIETQIWPTLATMDPWELEPALKALSTYLSDENLIELVDLLMQNKRYDTLYDLCSNLDANYEIIFAHIQEKLTAAEGTSFADLFRMQYLFFLSPFLSKVTVEFKNKLIQTPYTDLSGLQSWIHKKSDDLKYKFVFVLWLISAWDYEKYIPILRAMIQAHGTKIPGFGAENNQLCSSVAQLAADHGDLSTFNDVIRLSNVMIPNLAK